MCFRCHHCRLIVTLGLVFHCRYKAKDGLSCTAIQTAWTPRIRTRKARDASGFSTPCYSTHRRLAKRAARNRLLVVHFTPRDRGCYRRFSRRTHGESRARISRPTPCCLSMIRKHLGDLMAIISIDIPRYCYYYY